MISLLEYLLSKKCMCFMIRTTNIPPTISITGFSSISVFKFLFPYKIKHNSASTKSCFYAASIHNSLNKHAIKSHNIRDPLSNIYQMAKTAPLHLYKKKKYPFLLGGVKNKNGPITCAYIYTHSFLTYVQSTYTYNWSFDINHHKNK